MDGWVGGWMEVQAGSSIVYSNLKKGFNIKILAVSIFVIFEIEKGERITWLHNQTNTSGIKNLEVFFSLSLKQSHHFQNLASTVLYSKLW